MPQDATQVFAPLESVLRYFPCAQVLQFEVVVSQDVQLDAQFTHDPSIGSVEAGQSVTQAPLDKKKLEEQVEHSVEEAPWQVAQEESHGWQTLLNSYVLAGQLS